MDTTVAYLTPPRWTRWVYSRWTYFGVGVFYVSSALHRAQQASQLDITHLLLFAPGIFFLYAAIANRQVFRYDCYLRADEHAIKIKRLFRKRQELPWNTIRSVSLNEREIVIIEKDDRTHRLYLSGRPEDQTRNQVLELQDVLSEHSNEVDITVTSTKQTGVSG
jgi:uncharacterized membrane protein YobD (UPF0266 family)